MSRRFLFLALFLILPVGCSHFHTGRTYLTEMSHDDTRFFNPRDDFPIVAGDTGRDWSTEEEMRARTPASEEDLSEDRFNQALREELRHLERVQLEDELEVYNQYKHKFGSVSEKIYFLKLSPYDREDYLLTRGFIPQPKIKPFTAQEKAWALEKQDIILGMKKNAVLESWGKPLRVDIAGNPRNENERWLYHSNGASKYIYFEAGEVQGWE